VKTNIKKYFCCLFEDFRPSKKTFLCREILGLDPGGTWQGPPRVQGPISPVANSGEKKIEVYIWVNGF